MYLPAAEKHSDVPTPIRLANKSQKIQLRQVSSYYTNEAKGI
jgi:hypothetical protein